MTVGVGSSVIKVTTIVWGFAAERCSREVELLPSGKSAKGGILDLVIAPYLAEAENDPFRV